MGTVYYIARTDTKELFDIGKTGFWFAHENGLSNDNPTPSITADRAKVEEIVKYYEFDEHRAASVVERLLAFIGPGAVIIDEHALTLDDFDDNTWEWRGEVYKEVGCVYRLREAVATHKEQKLGVEFVAVAVGPGSAENLVRDVTDIIRLRQALRRTCAELQSSRGVTCGECELHETSAGALHVGSVGCGGVMMETRWGWWCPRCKFHPRDDDAIKEWFP